MPQRLLPRSLHRKSRRGFVESAERRGDRGVGVVDAHRARSAGGHESRTVPAAFRIAVDHSRRSMHAREGGDERSRREEVVDVVRRSVDAT